MLKLLLRTAITPLFKEVSLFIYFFSLLGYAHFFFSCKGLDVVDTISLKAEKVGSMVLGSSEEAEVYYFSSPSSFFLSLVPPLFLSGLG